MEDKTSATNNESVNLDKIIRNDEADESESAASMSYLKNIFLDFIEETGSFMEQIRSLVLLLEKDNSNLYIVNDIFRLFHTVKGNCGCLGIKDIGFLCHNVETMLDSARKSNLHATQGFIDLIIEVIDTVNKILPGLPWSLRDKYSLTENELCSYPNCDPVDIHPLMKKTETFIFSEELKNCVTESPKIGEILLASGEIDDEQLNKALMLQERKLGEILIDEGILPASKVKLAIEIQKSQKSSNESKPNLVKVDMDRIDHLFNLVERLVQTQTLISQNPAVLRFSSQYLQQDLSNLGVITREIQDLVMAIRMTSLKQTFHKMMLVVRDVAKLEGKFVELIISGEDTEVDKSMLEEISDSLIHLLRNSIDHGIEPPAERLALGKAEKGTVYLDAFHREGFILIGIRDDGRGISKERIFERAVELGFAKADDKLTDQQMYQLLFYPGFSTAEILSEISGRGVGLDIVRRNIEKLHGRIEIQSKEGEGTLISVTIPLTVAVINGKVVRADI